ncbi:MAG: hypothetical protein AAB423_02175 [Patescibacteria group bacterium]
MDDEKSRKILSKLEKLAQQPGFLRVLADIMVSDMFYAVEEAVEVDWRSRVSNQEATLLAGYMVKKPVLDDTSLTQKQIDASVIEVRKLLDELHNLQSLKMFENLEPREFQGLSPEEIETKLKTAHSQGSSMVEPIFYGDSGAYDFQFIDTAPELYAEDETWLDANFMDLKTAGKYYWAAYNYILAKATIGQIDKDQALAPIEIMAFSKDQLIDAAKKFQPNDEDINDASATRFLELFGAKPGNDNQAFSTPGEYNVINSHPLIEVADDYYFMPINLNLAEAIYLNPFYGMITDPAYKDKVAKHRGDAVEDITHNILTGTFGDKVYKRVKVNKGNSTLTDIDVMVIVGNKAIIFQCKGKKLTELSRRGDTETLKRDFENAIQKSYDEAVTIRTTLLGDEEYKLVNEAGEEITLPNGLDDAYIVCVTADVYPAALHQASQYLIRTDDGPYCLPISLFDLATTAEYLKNPFEFLFYVKQRLDTIESLKAESEMAYLGYHLRKRLIMPQGKDKVLVTQDFGQLIDADFLHRKGRLPEPPEEHRLISDEDNPTRARIIKEVSSHPSPDITDIVMFLYGISDDDLEEIGGHMERIKQSVRTTGKTNDMSVALGERWGGLTYVCAPTYPELHKAMLALSEINKHRSKSEQWLALGTVPGEERLVSYALYSNKPWEPSESMDKLVNQHEQNGGNRKKKIVAQKVSLTKSKKEKAKKKAARKNRRKGRK